MTSEKKKLFQCPGCGYGWIEGTIAAHNCFEYLNMRLKKCEREYLLEHRIIELLIAGGFVATEKVAQARNLLLDMP